MRLASRTQSSSSSLLSGWNIHHLALDMVRQGEKIIVLTVGDTDFPSPAAAVQAVTDSLSRGRTHYTESSGTRELRKAVADRHRLISGQSVAPDQVVITVGAQNALLTAALCLLDPGDEAIVPEPMYSTYPGTIASVGANAVSVPSSQTMRFHMSIDGIERAVTARTKAIFLANPNNPTGAVYTQTELRAVADICMRHDFWLVSDEVYSSLVYEGQHVSACSLPGMNERTVTIGSLSKSHAMAGWRLGWMIAPQALAAAATKLSGYSTYGIPTFIQDAAIIALEREPYATAGLKEAYERRRQLVCESLSGIDGVSPQWPEGGMFVMLDVSETGLTAYAFAEELLNRKQVAILPADAFGPSTASYLRINLGAPDVDLETATRRIAEFSRELRARQHPLKRREIA